MASLPPLILRVVGDISDLERSLNDAAGPIANIKRSFGAIGGAALAAGAAGAAALGAGLGAAVIGGVRDASELQAQMSGVTAVLGATAAEADLLKSQVANLAVDPGLKVSAQEAAAAIEMLAKNGLSVDQIMAGATRNVILMSNATGGDFAQSADIATDVMALWNIEVANMSGAVDGITSVVNASKFGINDYALALAQGGGVAASVGVEFDDFNTAIAAISPMFASGADAGTSFKTFLQRLVPGSSAAADAMADLGLITEDGANRFFDAAGNMKSMEEIAGVLADATGDLSEQQKIAALSTIFGSDALRAANGLASVGAVEFANLQAVMSETSAAENAATRIDNLSGDMEIFKSIIGGLKIQIGDALLPVLRRFAQYGTELAANYGPVLVGIISTIGGAVGDFFARLENGQTFLDNVKTGLMQLAGAAAGDNLQTFYTLRSAIDTLWQSVATAVTFVRSALEPVIQWAQNNIQLRDVLLVLGAAILSIIAGPILGIIAAVATVAAVFAGAVAAVAFVRNAWTNDLFGIRTTVQNVLDAIGLFWDNHGARIMEIARLAWQFIRVAVDTTVTALRATVTTFLDNVTTFWQTHKTAITKIVTTLWTAAKNIFDNWLRIIKLIFTGWTAGLLGDTDQFKADMLAAIRLMWENVKTIFRTAKTIVTTIFAETVAGIRSQFTSVDWLGIGRAIVTGIANGITGAAGAIADAARAAASQALESAKSWLGINSPSVVFARNVGQPIAAGIAAGIANGSGAVIAAAGQLATDAVRAAAGGRLQLAAEQMAHPLASLATAGGPRAEPIIIHETYNLTAADNRAIALYAQMTRRDQQQRLARLDTR